MRKLLALFILLLVIQPIAFAQTQTERPKLVVGIIVDQDNFISDFRSCQRSIDGIKAVLSNFFCVVRNNHNRKIYHIL